MSDDRMMSAADIARTSNEWMRRYLEEPEKFEAEFRTITRFLTDQSEGREPDYGARCVAYQFHLLDELGAEAEQA